MDKKMETRLARADSDRISLTFCLIEIEKLKAKRIFDAHHEICAAVYIYIYVYMHILHDNQ